MRRSSLVRGGKRRCSSISWKTSLPRSLQKEEIIPRNGEERGGPLKFSIKSYQDQ